MLDDTLPSLIWKKKSLGIPLPENRQVTKSPFMVFDRYEIHSQAFVHFTIHIFQSASPQNYFQLYIIKFSQKNGKP